MTETLQNLRARRGSALLIVLGMLAFILVSAVAFAAYMRVQRLPSSYLRRSSSSRLLAKAAMAEAIEMIDCAIGNNPYPGIDQKRYCYPRNSYDTDDAKPILMANSWKHRVFMGNTNGVDLLLSPEQTAASLCLEGLAYIPTPILNEARFYSRRSYAGAWHMMGYDAGRYALTAIDVSDYFDVNRTVASVCRNSSDAERISISYLFENADGNGYDVTPTEWNNWVKQYFDRTSPASKVPFVSVADFNLALYNNPPKGDAVNSPFCRYVMGEIPKISYDVDPTDPYNEQLRKQRRMIFVTDSIRGGTNVQNQVDITDAAWQPFPKGQFPDDDPDAHDAPVDLLISQGHSKFLDHFQNELCGPEVVQLYDYLDFDSVPASLCLPTAERTPMVTGIQLINTAIDMRTVESFTKTITEEKPTGQGKVETHFYTINGYDVKLFGEISAMVSVVFPFKHLHGDAERQRIHQCRLQLGATLTIAKKKSCGALRRADAVFPFVIPRDRWSESRQEAQLEKVGEEETPVAVTFFSEPIELNDFNLPVSSVDDVVIEKEVVIGNLDDTLNFTVRGAPTRADGTRASNARFPEDSLKSCAYWVVEETQNEQGESFSPRKVEDSAVGARLPNEDLTALELASTSEAYVPSLQIWARIVDGNGKTVDQAPAYCLDDEQRSDMLPDLNSTKTQPLLRFYGKEDAMSVTFTPDRIRECMSLTTQVLYPEAYVVSDPRFNYAPENFIAYDPLGSSSLREQWLTLARNDATGSECDGDIFLSVSDAGYLQSPWELGFLLRINGFAGNNDGLGLVDADHNGLAGSLPAKNVMWRTYRPEDIKLLQISESGHGARITPYTSQTEVMNAVVVNTPVDWWAAGTNDCEGAIAEKTQMRTDTEYALKNFAYSPRATDESRNLARTQTDKLANAFIDLFHSDLQRSWEDLFDDASCGWRTDDDTICGVDLAEKNASLMLNVVDKKFLHGYWRGCFANRQQLFLIFVRAEPTMMGGGAMGQAPPQLGARAMALVWRDPTVTEEDVNGGQPRPHRTRILFYRQFD